VDVKSLNPIKLLQMIYDELHLLRIAYETAHKAEMDYAKQRLSYEKHPISRKRLMEYATAENLVIDPDWDLEQKGRDDDSDELGDAVNKDDGREGKIGRFEI